jgi:hypothetical protein
MFTTMLEVFQLVLPKGLCIQTVIEESSNYKITVEMKGYSTVVYLPKCVAPGASMRTAYSIAAAAMSSLYINRGKIDSARFWLEQASGDHRFAEFTVVKRDTTTGRETLLYEYIDSLEDAYVLCQLAMTRKENHEVVFIYPGSNKSLYEKEDLYKKALDLEYQVLEYMNEDFKEEEDEE